MATSPNPFTGSGWSPAPPSGGGGPMGNPLFAWPGQNVNQSVGGSMPSAPTSSSGPPVGAWGNPGNLPNPTSNIKDITRNTGYENLLKGQFGLSTAEDFANLMRGYAGPAGDFFKTLMNLGSPYYQAKQANVFGQGVNQNQNAAALTNQELASRGYGAAPSGISAATIGAENMQGGQNLVQNFLNSLFQDEQLQTAGASGLNQIAGMFNPAPFLGNTSTPGSTQGPSAGQTFAQILGSLFGSGGLSSFGGGSGGGNPS